MTVLVTGAMGQLGKHVTRILLSRGQTVVALDIENKATRVAAKQLQADSNQCGKLITAFVNLLDADAVHKVIASHQPTAIIHLAAFVAPPCYRNPALARRINVDGTRHLVNAAMQLAKRPFFIEASSSAVYGSRNPHSSSGRIAPDTPVNPIECYGEDKVAAENLIVESGLPYALLRLGGILSPDGMGSTTPEYFLFLRALPRDGRVHMVDARDAALAFANAVDRCESLQAKILLIGGKESCVLLQQVVQDDVMQAAGLGRIGPASGLDGDPSDDRGWGVTDWFDTTESQRLLEFQQHDWAETLMWVAASQGWRRTTIQAVSPLLRFMFRTYLAVQKKREHRGRYANPWDLISRQLGIEILARRGSE